MRGEGVKKYVFFVHAQVIKTVHAGGRGGGQKMAKFCPRVVVECPLTFSVLWIFNVHTKTMDHCPGQFCANKIMKTFKTDFL